MVNKTLTYKELFDLISKKEQHTFKPNVLYNQTTKIEIPNENGEMILVTGMMIKKAPLIQLNFKDGTSYKAARNHIMLDGAGIQRKIQTFDTNDKVYNINGNKTIKGIEHIMAEDDTVFDVMIDSDTSLYQCAEGFVHHNTHDVTKTVKEYLGPEGEEWVHVKGKLSPFGLYKELFVNRDRLIVFDDADSVFDNQETNNMLKAALDSYEERWISWSSNKTINVSRMDKDSYSELLMDTDEKFESGATDVVLPSKFPFYGKVIFISNLPASKLDSAVLSRSYSIDMNISAKGMLARMKTIAPKLDSSLPIEDRMEVIEYISDIYGKNTNKLNLRTLILAMNARESGSKVWQRIIKYA